MNDGMIKMGSPIAKKLGFTSDKFADSWIWKTGDAVYLSMIISKHPGKGNLRKLIQNILNEGLNVKIPTPSKRMEKIARRMGFVWTVEQDPQMGRIDLLYKVGVKK